MHEPHHRPRKAVRPGRRQRHAVYAGTGLLLLSGLLWLLAHYALPLPEDAARHPLEAWAMRVHGAATLFGMAVLGGLWGPHVLRAWAGARHRLSGGSLLGLWFGLALSGYGLYYVADEGFRATISGLHVVAGSGLPVALAIHILTAVSSRRMAAE